MEPSTEATLALPQLLQTLARCLGDSANRLQLWVDDDRGLHPRAIHGGAVRVADRALARLCCLRADLQCEGPRAALPVALSDRRIGALLVELAHPIDAGELALLQRWIETQRAALDRSLTHERLARLSGGARRAEALRHALAAARALETSDSMREAFGALHLALRALMRAENFFVVLLDEAREWLHFEYHHDEYDRISSWAPVRFLEGRLQGLLSAIVVASARVLRGHTEELLEQAGHGDTATDLQFGPNASDWIGVPMLVGEEAIGALVLQDYTPNFRYADADPGILSLLAEACAAALHRRRVQQTLERTVAERTAELEASLQRLRTTQQQLVEAEKQAALGRLVAGIAHEINTPLGTCVTAASHLQEASADFTAQLGSGLRRAELERYLKLARDSSHLLCGNLQRMASLVNRFSQIAAAVDAEHRTLLPLSAWLERWAATQSPRIQAAGHQLHCQIQPELSAAIPPSVLNDILGELLDNSLQHAAMPADRLNLELRVAHCEGRITLHWSDDGGGLPPVDARLLFDPFYTTARHRGQIGLGLHRVHILVTQVLNAAIHAETAASGGSRFTLQLPPEA